MSIEDGLGSVQEAYKVNDCSGGESKRAPDTDLKADKSIEVLYDHYKESNAQVAELRNSRNRTFVFMLIGLLALGVLNPRADDLLGVISGVLLSRLGGEKIDSPVNIMSAVAFNILLWTFVVVSLIHYYRMSSHTFRMYGYLIKLENMINSYFGRAVVSREGADYYGADRSADCECRMCSGKECKKCYLIAVERSEKGPRGLLKYARVSGAEVSPGTSLQNVSGGVTVVDLMFRYVVPFLGIVICIFRYAQEWAAFSKDQGLASYIGISVDGVLCLLAVAILFGGGLMRGWEL